ncbi:MAG: hypothetical protein JJE22_04060 [Bacteroidia bacterium]|nr:hypothetical protein [Bacteroidia bacterium]
MKRNKIAFSFIILPVLIMSSIMYKNNAPAYNEDTWSGTASFQSTETSSDRTSVWKMEANIKANKGTVVHSRNFTDANGDHGECKSTDTTDLILLIDENIHEYSIMIPAPPCKGDQLLSDQKIDYYEPDAMIQVEKQKFGTNQQTISGQIVTRDTAIDDAITVEITNWHFKKDKKSVKNNKQ